MGSRSPSWARGASGRVPERVAARRAALRLASRVRAAVTRRALVTLTRSFRGLEVAAGTRRAVGKRAASVVRIVGASRTGYGQAGPARTPVPRAARRTWICAVAAGGVAGWAARAAHRGHHAYGRHRDPCGDKDWPRPTGTPKHPGESCEKVAPASSLHLSVAVRGYRQALY